MHNLSAKLIIGLFIPIFVSACSSQPKSTLHIPKAECTIACDQEEDRKDQFVIAYERNAQGLPVYETIEWDTFVEGGGHTSRSQLEELAKLQAMKEAVASVNGVAIRQVYEVSKTSIDRAGKNASSYAWTDVKDDVVTKILGLPKANKIRCDASLLGDRSTRLDCSFLVSVPKVQKVEFIQ